MSGFDKIEFAQQKRTAAATTQTRSSAKVQPDFAKSQSNTEDLMAKRRKNSGPKKFKVNKKVTIGLAVFVVLCILIAIPSYFTYQSGLKTYRQAQLIKSAIKKQNIELAGQEIAKTKEYLNETQRNLGYLLPLKFVPVVGWYYSDAESMLNAGEHSLDSAKIVTDSLTPYADVLGLKGNDSFAGGSTEDRIKTAVLSMGKITPEIDKIEASISKAQKEIDKVNPDHYPKIIFGNKVNEQLTTLKLTADQTATAVRDAKPLIKTLPSLLGEKEAKRYLVLFQNDKELRATGGFITAYAIFSIDKGNIKFEKSDDIYKLDDSIRNKPKAPAPIVKYFPKVYTLNLRDSNLSPDFLESMKTFEEMYERASLKEDVDGIIAIDTHVLVSTVKILDDQVQAGGRTFTTQNDPRCECPQIIYELENDISRPVNYIKTDRKSIIGELISAIMVKALSSSPQQYWGPLFQSIIAQTNQKHIMFKLYDEQAQQGIVALNAAGQIKPFEGDYLHINEVNFSGAKVNIFMEEKVDVEYKVDKDGTITKTLTIKYKNPFPPSDCNLERGGLCLNAEYRDWIRIYVPEGSELIESKGSQVKMTTYEELGKTVFDGLVTVRPKGVATFTLTYKLPFKHENGKPLPLLIQKQPGTAGHEYQITVDGKAVEMFNLTTDKETKVTLKR